MSCYLARELLQYGGMPGVYGESGLSFPGAGDIYCVRPGALIRDSKAFLSRPHIRVWPPTCRHISGSGGMDGNEVRGAGVLYRMHVAYPDVVGLHTEPCPNYPYSTV